MLRHLDARRSLALTAVVAVASWSTGALPAAADPGNGNGRGVERSSTTNGRSHGPDQGRGNGSATTGKGRGARTQHEQHRTGGQRAGRHRAAPQGRKAHGGPTTTHGKGAGGGNNGTVKIAPHGPVDRIPDNHPHVGCTFQVEWYGFDGGSDVVSQVAFTPHAPTGNVGMDVDGPSRVLVGGDPQSGAGTDTGFDAVAVYTLSFAGAGHPKQGYHVRLTVHTPRSHGNDTKQKVFWVRGCDAPPEQPPGEQPPGEQPPGETPPGETPPGETPPGETPPDEHPPVSAPPEPAYPSGPGSPSTLVSGPGTPPQGSPPSGPEVPTVVDAGLAGGDDATASSVPLLLVALGGGLAGGAVLVRRRQVAVTRRR